jgi:hypothetical protein
MTVASGRGQTRRIAVWHTNAIVVNVPAEMTDNEAERHVLSLVDAGRLHFAAVEGGVERDVPTWWNDDPTESADTSDQPC